MDSARSGVQDCRRCIKLLITMQMAMGAARLSLQHVAMKGDNSDRDQAFLESGDPLE